MKTHILIIDDEPRWISFAKSDLATSFEIIVVPDADAALAELEAGQFSLVIASSHWLDALKDIGQKYVGKPIVVTTVQPTNQEARSAYRLGARGYFAKSFNSDDLFDEISKVIPTADEIEAT